MSALNPPSRAARYGSSLVVAVSLLSLSALGCDGGSVASTQADDEPRSAEDTVVGAGSAAGGDDGAEEEEETDRGGDDVDSNASGPRPIASCASERIARDPYEIRSRSVDGDVLTIVLTHGGGCRQHDFSLCYEPELLETNPVQVNLRLGHDANGDVCRRIDRKVLEFDLSPLRDHYRAAHPNGDAVVLNLGEPITYEL